MKSVGPPSTTIFCFPVYAYWNLNMLADVQEVLQFISRRSNEIYDEQTNEPCMFISGDYVVGFWQDHTFAAKSSYQLISFALTFHESASSEVLNFHGLSLLHVIYWWHLSVVYLTYLLFTSEKASKTFDLRVFAWEGSNPWTAQDCLEPICLYAMSHVFHGLSYIPAVTYDLKFRHSGGMIHVFRPRKYYWQPLRECWT